MAGVITGLQTGQNQLILWCLYLYFVMFNISIGCCVYAYIGRTSEAAGISLANMTLWGTSLSLALTTQTLFDVIKPSGAFLLFGTNCVIAGVFCLLYLKEITGLTSDQAKSVYKPSRDLKTPLHVKPEAEVNASFLSSTTASSPLPGFSEK